MSVCRSRNIPLCRSTANSFTGESCRSVGFTSETELLNLAGTSELPVDGVIGEITRYGLDPSHAGVNLRVATTPLSPVVRSVFEEATMRKQRTISETRPISTRAGARNCRCGRQHLSLPGKDRRRASSSIWDTSPAPSPQSQSLPILFEIQPDQTRDSGKG